MSDHRPRAAARALAADERRSRWRQFWMMSAALVLLAASAAALRAQEAGAEDEIITTHVFSTYGSYKYPADFEHLDYVNPDAPKGGEIAVWFPGTFDTFNPYSRKGRAGYLSSIPYESLLTGTADEQDAAYGLLAESMEYPASQDWVIFNMRPEARFSDGTPVTAEDVKFTHDLFLEQGLISYREAVKKRVLSAEVLDTHRIKFTFAPDIPRRALIDQVGGTPVMSKKWFEETGARLDESRLEPAIGSGPYVLDSYDINQRIIYKRNPDYWGEDLPINKGRNNFDTIRVEYFADSNAAFEGFKGGAYTFRQENSSRSWATGYDFPALDSGDVIKTELPNGNIPAAGGFVFNLGKPKFQDIRVREAISLAYNFEWTNASVQFGLFKQRHAFWENSELAATGVPEGAELELLKSVESPLPEGVLTEPAVMAHSSGERQLDRRNLRRASALLEEAGWVPGDDGIRRNAAGETLSLELLENSPTFDRIALPFIENLKQLGIDATYNRVDPAQFTNRRRDRDYDMIYTTYSMSPLPSTGLYQQFGQENADVSVFNPAGLSDPAVDELIDAVVAADVREDLTVAVRALDRVLRAKRFIIPAWYNDSYWVAYYDMYEHPEELPPYDLGQLDFWWVNPDKQAALKASGALR